MASRTFLNFFQTLIRGYVRLAGRINLVAPVQASVVAQGLTYTAKALGLAGNGITITLTAGAVAGAEVVTVVGKAITVQIQTGVSTQNQVKAAIDGSGPASALVSVSAASGATAVNAAAAVTTAGAVASVSSASINGATVAHTGVGEYTVTLNDSYPAIESVQLTFGAATAVDLKPQHRSDDSTGARTIVFRLLAGAVPTNLAAPATVFFGADLRNSSLTK